MPDISPCDIRRRTSKDQGHSPAATQNIQRVNSLPRPCRFPFWRSMGVISPPPRTPFPFPLKSQIAFSPWDPFMTIWTGWGLICRIASPFPPVTPIKTKARKVPDATLCYERPAFKTMTLFRGCGGEGSALDVLRCSLRAWGRSRGVPPSESKSRETKLPKDARWHSSPELVPLGAARCAVATPTADIEIHSG